ncbi:hypothetical protein BCR35DRAFT_299345 [Leucosporidium creatinivorum]|uniref:RPA43 OB domain-containing protein n=1 Tax=Leucosporidium creatinivorum TaxID=106004 RepID=A0A1Y2G1K6_9BASI|nr:hypothetical protein BCR35DRAFT_299345 [Leucosporidium creatinivorum]
MASASSSNLRLQAITSSDPQSEFIQFRASMRLPIAPRWAADGTAGGAAGTGGMEGVKEVLASWVMRYLPPLRAVLLTFDPLPTFAHQTESFPASKDPFTYAKRRSTGNALLSEDDDEEEDEEALSQNGEKPVKQIKFKVLPMIEGSGFGLANVEFKGMAWRPRVGQKIVGSPTLSTPSHISLLIHNLFNASIPASHIQTNDYHFDPEFPVPEAIQKRQQLSFPSAIVEEEKTEQEEVEEKAEVADEEELAELEDRKADEEVEEDKEEEEIDEEAQEEEAYREKGWWRHNVTNEPLGGDEGRIEFTIVGITIANSMISLTGSLLADPFSPAAAAATTSATAPKIKKAAKAAAKAAKASSKKRPRADSESDAGDDSDAFDSDSSRSPSPPALKAPPKVEPGADSEVESEEEEVVEAPKKQQKKDKASKEKGSKEKGSKDKSKKKSKKVKQE